MLSDTRLGLILNTYIFQNISPIQLTDYVPGVLWLKTFWTDSAAKGPKWAIDSSFSFTCVHEPGWTWGNQNCWQWCWTQLEWWEKALKSHLSSLLSTLFDDTVGTAVEIVWAKKADVASLAKEQKSSWGKVQSPKISQNLPSCYSTLTSTSCCRLVFNKAQTLIRGRQR